MCSFTGFSTGFPQVFGGFPQLCPQVAGCPQVVHRFVDIVRGLSTGCSQVACG